jgi:3-hexulose-6-phosphate synthase / 6-phospho-3-hexuloisomerase
MILQVALDFVDLDRALKVAEEVKDSVDWIEAGTPLIKACGMDVIRELKRAYPGKKIVADLKIADTGDIETEMAAKAGADIVTVLGAVDDQTIIHAVEAAKNFGCEVLVDLLNVENLESQARRAEELGADYVMVHTGIDQQMIGKDVFSSLRSVYGSVSIPIAVGGGLTLENVQQAVAGGGNVIIIGGAITKAPDAKKVAADFRKRIDDPAAIKAGSKKSETVGEMLVKVSTSNVSDAMHRKGEMRGLRPVWSCGKFFGKAFTVKAYPGDWSKTVQSIDSAKAGDVIVIDAHESKVALWGELASRSAVSRKIAGLVIDGGVRDVEEIEKMGFPIYARCISPAAGEPKGMGELDVPIHCGGLEVEPGDYILADRNGVVVLPKKRAVEIAKRAVYVKEKEERVKKEIEDGKTLGQILELGKWEKA